MNPDIYYGIDIGGTSIKISRFTPEGLAKKWSIPTDRRDSGRNILSDIASCLSGNATAAALAVPGAVLPDGTVNRCINLGWGLCRPGEELEARTGIPCRVLNDANAAALGEHWKGRGQGYSSLLMVTLGTGVGTGIVQNGILLAGAHGAAGELGHMCMDPLEPTPCTCGRRGCLEQYCSASGITAIAAQAGLFVKNAREVFTLAAAGNTAATTVVDKACDTLGRGLAIACCALDPEIILLGGGVSLAGEALRARTEAAFRAYAFHAHRDTPILLAGLGNDAGIYGAAKLAMMPEGYTGV